MSTLVDVQNQLASDPTWIGTLITNPQTALSNAGINLTALNDVRQLESFVRLTQGEVALAGTLISFNPSVSSDWGIGISCCSSKCINQYDPACNPS